MRSSHLYEDKEHFHFDQKFRKLHKKSKWFGEFLKYFFRKLGDSVPLNFTSGIGTSEIQQFSDFSGNFPRKFPSSKVTECFGRIETPSRSAEFLKCACCSTENSIRISIKFNQFNQSLAPTLDDKQKKPVNLVFVIKYGSHNDTWKPRETCWIKVAKQNNSFWTSPV